MTKQQFFPVVCEPAPSKGMLAWVDEQADPAPLDPAEVAAAMRMVERLRRLTSDQRHRQAVAQAAYAAECGVDRPFTMFLKALEGL